MAKQKEVSIISIPPPQIERLDVTIVGELEQGLLVHAWSEKAKKEMLAKQMKKAKQGREAKDPERDFRESLYWMKKTGKSRIAYTAMGDKQKVHDMVQIPPKKVDPNKHELFGFKSIAFKAAAVRAANDVGLAMTFTRRAFHILGEFVKLEFSEIVMREDMVRIGMGTADLRYRGEFLGWSAVLPIRYNARIISPEQIFNLLNTAGFGVGVGEWRPERYGVHGMFHVK